MKEHVENTEKHIEEDDKVFLQKLRDIIDAYAEKVSPEVLALLHQLYKDTEQNYIESAKVQSHSEASLQI